VNEDLSEPIVEAADSIDQEDAQVKSSVVEQTLALAIGKKFVWIVVSFVSKFVEGEFLFGIIEDQGKLGSFRSVWCPALLRRPQHSIPFKYRGG